MAGSGQALADIDPIAVWIGEREGALAAILVGQSLDDPDAAEGAEIAATQILR